MHRVVTSGDRDEIPILWSNVQPFINLAIFIAMLDKDPMVGYNWLKSNRLSVFSIPGFKGHIVEDMETIVTKGIVPTSNIFCVFHRAVSLWLSISNHGMERLFFLSKKGLCMPKAQRSECVCLDEEDS